MNVDSRLRSLEKQLNAGGPAVAMLPPRVFLPGVGPGTLVPAANPSRRLEVQREDTPEIRARLAERRNVAPKG
jgi:hypothetical protein